MVMLRFRDGVCVPASKDSILGVCIAWQRAASQKICLLISFDRCVRAVQTVVALSSQALKL